MQAERRCVILPAAALLLAAAGAGPGATSQPAGSDVPDVPDVPDVIMLFDGGSWSDGWITRDGGPSPWQVQPDGSVLVGPGDAVSRHQFTDYQLHVEFLCPQMPGKEGQARANSGVYLQGDYEVQVLDTYGQPAALNGCGAVYSIAPPMVNASRPAGEWQTYDIIFHAARYDDAGTLTGPPRLTVIHNGVVIHDDLELPAHTPGGLGRDEADRTGPLLLQDHGGDPVRYRRIWTRPLPE